MSLVPFRSMMDDPFFSSNDWLIKDPFRDEFFAGFRSPSGMDLTRQFAPLMTTDLVENDSGYQVMADLPGVDPADLDLSIEGNSLVMKAERNYAHEKKTDKIHMFERSYGSVQRRVSLPKNADLSNASTKFANGVLTVTFPKLAEVPPSSRKLLINRE